MARKRKSALPVDTDQHLKISLPKRKRLIRLFGKLENYFADQEGRQYHQAVDCIIFLREFLAGVKQP